MTPGAGASGVIDPSATTADGQALHHRTLYPENIPKKYHKPLLRASEGHHAGMKVENISPLCVARKDSAVPSRLAARGGSVDVVAQIASLETHAKEVQHKLKELCDRNDELRTQRNEARIESARHARQASQLEEQLRHSTETAQAKEEKLERLVEALKEQREQLEATLAHREKRLDAAKAEAEARLAGLEKHVLAAQHAAEMASQENQALKSKLKESEDDVRNSQVSLREHHTLANNFVQLQQELLDKDRRLRDCEARLEEMERKYNERCAAVKAGELRAEGLEARLVKLQNSLHSAEKTAKAQDDVTLDLENQLSVAENELSRIKVASVQRIEKLTVLEGHVTRLESDLQARDWRIEDLLCQIDDFHHYACSMENERDAAQARIVELTKQRASDIDDGLRTLHSLECDTSALRAAASKRDIENRALREEVSMLQSRLQEGNTDEELMNTTKPGVAKELAMLRAKAAHAEAVLTKLRASLASEKAANRELEKRVVGAEARVAQGTAAKVKAEAEVKRLRAALESKRQQVQQLLDERKDNHKQKEDVMNKRVGLADEEKLAEEGIVALEKAGAQVVVAELQATMDGLEAALEESRATCKSQESRVRDLLVEVRELRDAAVESERQRSELQGALASAKESEGQRIAETEAAVRQLETRLRAAEDAVSEARREAKAAADLAVSQETEAEGLRLERTALMDALDQLQNVVSSQETKHEDIVRQLREDLEKREADLVVRTAELKEVKSNITATEALIERLAASKMKAFGVSQGEGLKKNGPIVQSAPGKENGGGDGGVSAARTQRRIVGPLREMRP